MLPHNTLVNQLFKNQMLRQITFSVLVLSSMIACSVSVDESTAPGTITDIEDVPNTGTEVIDDQAAVVGVSVTGSDQSYTFSVTIESPDTGCDQYADWWEVLNADGELLYRRILGHSHVAEQPFTRSGGPVAIGADDFIYVRGHQSNLGYGTRVYSGTINSEMKADTLDASFAEDLLTQSPLPTDCAY